MVELFLHILNMSITASWIVLAVLLVRMLIPRVPKWVHCLLWSFVALRLLVPVFVESTFSLIPSAQVIPTDIAYSETPAIYSGIPAVNNAVNPFLALQRMTQARSLEQLLDGAALIWLGGVAALLLYSIATSLRLRWQIRTSVPVRKNVYICDEVRSPFVFGIFRPRVYLPSDISEEQTRYVLAHEQAHIRRRDHWWKPLGFLLLTLHWFNPLLWLAYVLLCRDIEQACDERVIAPMDNQDKKGYSQALLACSVHRRLIAACPIAFGEVSVKTRIKGVLNYKKPAFWLITLSVAVCAAVAVCFLTNPVGCWHQYTSQITLAPTCTQRGMQTKTCRLCQHSYSQPVEVLQHSYDAGTVTVEPTCLELGIREFRCTGCGITKTDTVEKTPHIAGEPRALQEPNCTELGCRTATCTYCREVFVTEVLPVNDVHALTEEVLRKPTCTTLGEGLRTCSRCDYQESCSYEKLAHSFKVELLAESTCAQMGEEKWTCIGCGYTSFKLLPMGREHHWEKQDMGYIRCRDCGWWRYSSMDYSFVDSGEDEKTNTVVQIWP